jgi:hypothetical protein
MRFITVISIYTLNPSLNILIYLCCDHICRITDLFKKSFLDEYEYEVLIERIKASDLVDLPLIANELIIEHWAYRSGSESILRSVIALTQRDPSDLNKTFKQNRKDVIFNYCHTTMHILSYCCNPPP